MMLRAWRLVKEKYAAEAFDGEGAYKFGGRWNSIGVRVVYASETIALATLEILVGGVPSNLLSKYVTIPVDFDDACIQTISVLPKDWHAYPPRNEIKQIGDLWVKRNASVVLKVPSPVIPSEYNYVINPLHPDAHKSLVIGKPEKYIADKRITDRLKNR